MQEWVALGGANSGCCGNAAHTYGFHRPAKAVPVADYSRRHEAGRPHNMNWACAGDFSHKNIPKLRAKHLTVLQRLMRGELPMICEFIGKPWAAKPVYYWARWNGVKSLQRYSGSGHDHWSHISWWRSRADERAHLWTPPGPNIPKPRPVPVKKSVPPKYPGKPMKFSASPIYSANLRVWQARMRQRGWGVAADGFFGPRTQATTRAFQKEKRLSADGVIGPKTWNAAWTTTITRS